MMELQDIVASLTNNDGTCRDVSFDGPSWEGVVRLIEDLEPCFHDCSVTDDEGQVFPSLSAASTAWAGHDGGSVFAVLGRGTGFLKRLQVFISTNDGSSPFVELTFFPEDVEHRDHLKRDFIEWVDKMRCLSGARRCYARHENASWQMADVSPESGVFLVCDE